MFAGNRHIHPLLRFLRSLRKFFALALGKILPHEALALGVGENSSFAANSFGDQNPHHAGRPDHPGRVKLKELHVDQFRSGFVGQRGPVAGVLPRVRRHLPRFAIATCGQHDGLGAEDDEASGLAPVGERAADSIAIFEQADDRALHEDLDSLMDAAILQRADHLQTGAVADVRQAFPGMAAERALKNPAVCGAIEDRPPFLQFPHAVGRFLGVELRHPPVIEELTAFHGVAEMRLPVVLRIDMRQRRRDSSLGHHRVRFAEETLADQGGLRPERGRLDRGAQSRTSGADHHDIELMALVLVHLRAYDPSPGPSGHVASRSFSRLRGEGGRRPDEGRRDVVGSMIRSVHQVEL